MTIMSPSKLVPTKRNFSLGSLELSNNNFYCHLMSSSLEFA